MSALFARLFPRTWPLIGVVHLLPLPGSPLSVHNVDEVCARALAEAEVLLISGFDGLIIENFGDYPFVPDEVEPHTVAVMSLITRRIVDLVDRLAQGRPFSVGVNVLRNDARSAVAIASMCGAHFIRVNVHAGAMVTDQGIIEGKAHATLRYRRTLGVNTAILADVLVKHAYPLGQAEPECVAKDTFRRGGATGLILSGRVTGEFVDVGVVRRVRAAVPEAPLLVGSGLRQDNIAQVLPWTDGAIVGTALKQDGNVSNSVLAPLARALVETRDALLSRDA